MYCKQCGKEVMEQSVVCPNCGAAVKRAATQSTNWVIVGAAIVTIIATFMPVVSFMGMSISFVAEETRTEGMAIIVLALIGGLLGYFRKGKFGFIPAAIALILYGYDVSPALDAGANTDIGGILIIVGTIAMIVGSIMEFVKGRRSPLA